MEDVILRHLLTPRLLKLLPPTRIGLQTNKQIVVNTPGGNPIKINHLRTQRQPLLSRILKTRWASTQADSARFNLVQSRPMYQHLRLVRAPVVNKGRDHHHQRVLLHLAPRLAESAVAGERIRVSPAPSTVFSVKVHLRLRLPLPLNAQPTTVEPRFVAVLVAVEEVLILQRRLRPWALIQVRLMRILVMKSSRMVVVTVMVDAASAQDDTAAGHQPVVIGKGMRGMMSQSPMDRVETSAVTGKVDDGSGMTVTGANVGGARMEGLLDVEMKQHPGGVGLQFQRKPRPGLPRDDSLIRE